MKDSVTVFVVDDDPAVRKSLRWLLESDGWQVATFSSGEEFLDSFDPSQPACLILDLHMPMMDGLAVQRQLAQRGYHPLIIFVTAYGEVQTSVRAMQQGAYDFLEKPVDGDRLLKLVRECAERDAVERADKWRPLVVQQRIASLAADERKVLELLLLTKPVAAIAKELGFSEQTVAEHRAAVLERFDVPNEVQLLQFMLQHSPNHAQ